MTNTQNTPPPPWWEDYRQMLSRILIKFLDGGDTPPPPSPKDPNTRGLVIASDSMVGRNRAWRRWEGLAILTVAFTVPLVFGWLIGRKLGIPLVGLSFGAGAGFWLACTMAKRVLVVTGQMQMLVTVDRIRQTGDPNVLYGPGRLFWKRFSESVSKRSNIPLTVITAPFAESVPGAESQLKVAGSYQYRVEPAAAAAFVGIDEGTISGGLGDLVLSQVSTVLADKTLNQAKAQIPDYNTHLSNVIGGRAYTQDNAPAMPETPASVPVTAAQVRDVQDRITEIEALYGIEVVTVTITGIDTTDEVQRARDLAERIRNIFNAAAQLLGLTPEELRARYANGQINAAQMQDVRRDAMAVLGIGSVTTIASTGGGRGGRGAGPTVVPVVTPNQPQGH